MTPVAAPARGRPRARRRAGAGGLSDPPAPGARQAARLPRQRGHDAEAAGGHRRDHALLHRRQRQRPPRRARAQRASRPRRTRQRAAQGRGVLQRPARRARSSSRATPPRASTSSRTPSGGRTSAAGDEVLISAMEHHSNIVPWQLLCEETGARLRVAPIDDRGELMLDAFERAASASGRSSCR